MTSFPYLREPNIQHEDIARKSRVLLNNIMNIHRYLWNKTRFWVVTTNATTTFPIITKTKGCGQHVITTAVRRHVTTPTFVTLALYLLLLHPRLILDVVMISYVAVDSLQKCEKYKAQEQTDETSPAGVWQLWVWFSNEHVTWSQKSALCFSRRLFWKNFSRINSNLLIRISWMRSRGKIALIMRKRNTLL